MSIDERKDKQRDDTRSITMLCVLGIGAILFFFAVVNFLKSLV